MNGSSDEAGGSRASPSEVAHRIRRLQGITRALARTTTIGEVLDVLLQHGTDAAEAVAGSLSLLADDGTHLEVVRSTGYRDELVGRYRRLPLDGTSPLSAAVRDRAPVVVESLGEHEGPFAALRAEAEAEGHAALAALPLATHGEVTGAIGLSFAEPQIFDDDQLAFLTSIAQHCAAALERARLIEAERDARRTADRLRRESERARDHLAFLVEVGRSVTETLDHRVLLQRVLDLAVPRIADAGLAYLPDDGELRRVAVTHKDPEARELGRRHVLGTSIAVDSAGPAAQCFRTGEIQVRRDVDRQDLSGAPDHIRTTVESYGMRAWLCVPIQAGRDILGVLALAFNDPDHLDDDDVTLAVELAGRTASGLINATLFEHERRVALALQEAVLPSRLPTLPGVELAGGYLPADAEEKVGGDWYDAFALPDGRLGIAIGDVSGHGLAAASMMSQLRNGLRAYAVDGARPSEVIARLNRLMLLTAADDHATVVYGTVDPDRGEVTWACAGHPPILHATSRGIDALGEPHGVLLGIEPDAACPEGRLVMEPGEAVVLYTDGVVERRDEAIDDSIAALGRELSVVAEPTAVALCDAALHRVRGPRGRFDDACVLAVRRPLPGPSRGSVT